MMTKKESEQLLIEANKLFVDANEYLDKDKIACLRIILKFKDYSDVFEQNNVRIESVIRALSELPEIYNEIANLYYFEGKSLREVAKIMGVSAQCISQLDERIIYQIKHLIKRYSVKQKIQSIENIEEKVMSRKSICILDIPKIIRDVFLFNSIDTFGKLLLLNTFQLQSMIGGGKDFSCVTNAIEKLLPGWNLPENKITPLKGNYFDLQKQEILMNVPINCLNLSTRTYNVLTRTGVKTLGDLLECSYDDLKRKRNMGEKCIKEIEETLKVVYPEYVLENRHLQINEIYERYGTDLEELKKLPIIKVINHTMYANTLLRNKVFTVDELIDLTSDELRSMNGLGKKGYEEIENTLNTLLPGGFKFKTAIQVSLATGLVCENEADVTDEIKTLNISDLNLSVRATNALRRKGADTIGKLLKLTKQDILSTRNIGVSTAEEVISIIKQHFPFWKEEIEVEENVTSLVANTVNTVLSKDSESEMNHLCITDVVYENECDVPNEVKSLSIWELNFSERAKYGLKRKGINTISQLLNMTKRDILSAPNIGIVTAEEMITVIKQHFPFWKEEATDKENIRFLKSGSMQNNFLKSEIACENEADVTEQIKAVSIWQLNFSYRAIHNLERRGIKTIGQLLSLSKKDILSIRNIGTITVEEITSTIKRHFPFWQE